jgi:ribose 5-phosphate isomerase B
MATLRRPLITELDVRRAARRGERTLDAHGASVTPSAFDAARQLNVELRGAASQATAPARKVRPSPSPSVPAPVAKIEGKARVIVGADHGGVGMKDAILATLRTAGHEVEDVGTFGSDAVDYPDFARAVAEGVASGRASVGIMVDGAGIGSCMVANKVPGVRAAMCHDLTTATNAREHNNANVLTLGGTLLGTRLALEVVHAFLRTPFAGGRHEPRVAKIDALDVPRRTAS